MEWVKQTGRFESGENLKLGNVVVGSAHYSSLRSKDDPKAWEANCLLPGMKRGSATRYMTKEEAKEQVEYRVELWMKSAGVSPNA